MEGFFFWDIFFLFESKREERKRERERDWWKTIFSLRLVCISTTANKKKTRADVVIHLRPIHWCFICFNDPGSGQPINIAEIHAENHHSRDRINAMYIYFLNNNKKGFPFFFVVVPFNILVFLVARAVEFRGWKKKKLGKNKKKIQPNPMNPTETRSCFFLPFFLDLHLYLVLLGFTWF